jgi:type III pantothenate kinase
MVRILADLGNSRLKLGRLDDDGALVETVALPLDNAEAWSALAIRWSEGSVRQAQWAVSSVNPPVAEQLRAFFEARGIDRVRWLLSATEIPVRHALVRPEFAGVDRALAVMAATELKPPRQPGVVLLCGTALVVERINADGVWEGGAIAPGVSVMAAALHLRTAMLPLIEVREAPPPWAPSTIAAMEAGLFWGMVGMARELIARQAEEFGVAPHVIWTGGDANMLAPWVTGPESRIEADLVLTGMAQLARRTDLWADGLSNQ